MIALVWLGSAYGMAAYGAPLLPRSLARMLSLQSFLSLVLVASTAVGLGASFALLPRWRHDLGLTRPSLAALVASLSSAPIVLVLSMYVGFEAALDTLMREIRAGGSQAAQANTGAFGRAIVETHILTTLSWAVVLTPVVEELMFRGALWSAVAGATRRFADRARSLPPELLAHQGGVGRFFLTGGIATLVSSAVFAWLHADQPGGAGIVRVVQATCLALVLGCVRHASGTVWPGVLLHAGFNLLSIAKSRKWLVSPGWPPPLPIPTILWQLAFICAVFLILWLVHRSPRARTLLAHASIFVARPRGDVFDFVVLPESIPLGFAGHGPIPRAESAEIISDGGMRVGARRRIHNADGSVVDEVIRALERPSHQAYEIVGGLLPPFSLFVRGGRGDWRLEDEGDGTRVTWEFSWDLRSGLFWPVAALFRRPFAAAMRSCLENHRSHLER